MSWQRWTKKQLRLYMSRDLYRQDIQNELSSMDEDIGPRTSHLDGMPKRSGGFHSSVESEAEHREEARERMLEQLNRVNVQVKQIESAIDTLSDDERSALEWSYMRTSLDTDREIAKQLKMSLRGFWRIKIKALHKVYVTLKGISQSIDLEEWVDQEEQKHKRSLKLKEEEQVEKKERRRKMTLGEIIKQDWAASPQDLWEKRMALLKRYDQMIEKDAKKQQKA